MLCDSREVATIDSNWNGAIAKFFAWRSHIYLLQQWFKIVFPFLFTLPASTPTTLTWQFACQIPHLQISWALWECCNCQARAICHEKTQQNYLRRCWLYAVPSFLSISPKFLPIANQSALLCGFDERTILDKTFQGFLVRSRKSFHILWLCSKTPICSHISFTTLLALRRTRSGISNLKRGKN